MSNLIEQVEEIVRDVAHLGSLLETVDIKVATAKILIACGDAARNARKALEAELDQSISLATHRAALNVVAKATFEAEKRAIDLTDDLEQCKIELQSVKDELADAQAESESQNWDRPIH